MNGGIFDKIKIRHVLILKLFEENFMESLKGTIFDVRRFATHDGDGIRTTFFFKAVRYFVRGVTIPKASALKNARFTLKKNVFIAAVVPKFHSAAALL